MAAGFVAVGGMDAYLAKSLEPSSMLRMMMALTEKRVIPGDILARLRALAACLLVIGGVVWYLEVEGGMSVQVRDQYDNVGVDININVTTIDQPGPAPRLPQPTPYLIHHTQASMVGT